MVTDLEGNKVVPGSMPGAGTRLIINGNLFRIIYVKAKSKPYRFTAEFIGEHVKENEFGEKVA